MPRIHRLYLVILTTKAFLGFQRLRRCDDHMQTYVQRLRQMVRLRGSTETKQVKSAVAYRTASGSGVKPGNHLGTKRAAFERAIDIGAKYCLLGGYQSPRRAEYLERVKAWGTLQGSSPGLNDELDGCLYLWNTTLSSYILDISSVHRVFDNIFSEGDWAADAVASFEERFKDKSPHILVYKNEGEDKGSESFVILDPAVATFRSSTAITIGLVSSSASKRILDFLEKYRRSEVLLGEFILTNHECVRGGQERTMDISQLNLDRLDQLLA